VLIPFGEENSKSQQSADSVSEIARLDEFIVLGDQNLCQPFWRRGHNPLAVKEMLVSDETIVWYIFHELSHGDSARLAAEVPELTIDERIALSEESAYVF
jgi:hypothetical protein